MHALELEIINLGNASAILSPCVTFQPVFPLAAFTPCSARTARARAPWSSAWSATSYRMKVRSWSAAGSMTSRIPPPPMRLVWVWSISISRWPRFDCAGKSGAGRRSCQQSSTGRRNALNSRFPANRAAQRSARCAGRQSGCRAESKRRKFSSNSISTGVPDSRRTHLGAHSARGR